jgi:serine/threonine protein kinase
MENTQQSKEQEEAAPEQQHEAEKTSVIPSASNDGDEVFLNKDIRIKFSEPLPRLDKGEVKAYRAIGSNKLSTNLFALVCDKSLTPRRMSSIKYTKIVNGNLAKMVGMGKVIWPTDKQEKFCFIYENTLGQRLIELENKNKPAALGWKPEQVLVNFVQPMIKVLQDLSDKDIVHGEIWPGNMFRSGEGAGEVIKLGECLSSPSSYYLPALYEPVERALASPQARGTGTIQDDLYSFGVSLAVILRSHDPMEGKTDSEIIEHKIQKGSYATLLSSDRFSGAILELLRGLLYDDPSQRWTLEDIYAWSDGRRLSPKQSTKRIKATRPIVLNNKKYIRPELLAKDMTARPDESAKLIESGELEQWIERAIEDKAIKIRFEQAMKEVAHFERNSFYNELLSTKIAFTLYPECPLIYRDLSFIPQGFGKALSYAYVHKQDLQPYIDILWNGFAIQSLRGKKTQNITPLINKFDMCRTFVNQTAIGSGLERCIYFLNPEGACLSPVLEKYYVQTPEDMMDAFESICSSSEPDVLFDRHVVAFLSVKDRKNIDPYLPDLRSKDRYMRVLGMIKTLATMQQRSRLGKFPAITNWVANNMEDLYERFHDKKRREELKARVENYSKLGDLTKIAALFDNPALYESDVASFHQAMEEYKHIDEEKNRIEKRLRNRKDYGMRSGQQFASIISVAVALLIIVISAYVAILKDMY